MTKRTVEMDDNLDDIIDSVKEGIRDNFIEFLKENPDTDDWDTYYQRKGCDAVNEISDSNTPIYTKEINDLYYLYSEEFEEAYKNAGIGNGDEDNHKAVAICMYLEAQGFDYLNDLQTTFEEWLADKEETDTMEEFIKTLEA
jgi:hypothetical protein